VSNFVELVKYIIAMLRKHSEIKWTIEAHNSFDQIKKALTEAPVLVSPNYSKDFLIFYFASFDTVAAVLLQKNVEGLEQSISFFSRALRDDELKYDLMDKQAYALVKALKSFRVYVLHSRVIAYVPSAVVKEILIQPNIDGKCNKWIVKILEFDLEIRPTKLVKGQGLANLLSESNCSALGVNFISSSEEKQQAELNDKGIQIIPTLADSSWYKDIIFFLQNLQPPSGMEKNKVRALKLKSIKYCLVDQILYWKDPLGVLLRCLDPQEAQKIMSYFHDSLCGGHHFWRTTAYKILKAGYFWHSLFMDVCAKIKVCNKCQKFSGK
jgi:hypothetical protein